MKVFLCEIWERDIFGWTSQQSSPQKSYFFLPRKFPTIIWQVSRSSHKALQVAGSWTGPRTKTKQATSSWSCLCAPGARATPCLPEPPAVRERLVQEIQFFVEYLQQQQQRQWQGGSGVAVSALAEENSRAILDYVARSKGANVCLFCLFVCLFVCLFAC